MTLVVRYFVSYALLSCQLTYLVGWLTCGTPFANDAMTCEDILIGWADRAQRDVQGPAVNLGIRWDPVVAPNPDGRTFMGRASDKCPCA